MTDVIIRISDYERRPRDPPAVAEGAIYLFPLRRVRAYKSGCSKTFRDGWVAVLRQRIEARIPGADAAACARNIMSQLRAELAP